MEEAKRILRRVLLYPETKDVAGGFRVTKVSATVVFKFDDFSASLNNMSRDNTRPSVSLVSANRPDFVLPEWCTPFMQDALGSGFKRHTYVPGMTTFLNGDDDGTSISDPYVNDSSSVNPTFTLCTLRAHLSHGRNVMASWDMTVGGDDSRNPFVTMTGDLSDEEARRIAEAALIPIVVVI